MMAAAPEEAVNARRDVPLGICISVLGCTVLYVLMALVITGALNGCAVRVMCKCVLWCVRLYFLTRAQFSLCNAHYGLTSCVSSA